MSYVQTISAVREHLTVTFAEVDRWFDEPESLCRFRPAGGSWTIDEVLEHISLTNHFLMLTLRKWVATALKRAKRGAASDGRASDLSRLDTIGRRGSFRWAHPAHMEPSGEASAIEVREILRQQAAECLKLLDAMPRGEGSLCKIRMTVNDLGKVDLYQWLYFIARHAERHVQQMDSIRRAYEGSVP